MKHAGRIAAGLVLCGVFAMPLAQGADPEPAAPTPAPTPAVPAAQEEKVIYTFKDDDQMKAFAQQWQQRRGMLVRMSVLKAYFEEEQARLQDLDQKLSADYKIDVNKNYVLDSKRRVILETVAPAEGAAPAATPAAGTSPAPAAAPATP